MSLVAEGSPRDPRQRAARTEPRRRLRHRADHLVRHPHDADVVVRHQRDAAPPLVRAAAEDDRAGLGDRHGAARDDAVPRRPAPAPCSPPGRAPAPRPRPPSSAAAGREARAPTARPARRAAASAAAAAPPRSRGARPPGSPPGARPAGPPSRRASAPRGRPGRPGAPARPPDVPRAARPRGRGAPAPAPAPCCRRRRRAWLIAHPFTGALPPGTEGLLRDLRERPRVRPRAAGPRQPAGCSRRVPAASRCPARSTAGRSRAHRAARIAARSAAWPFAGLRVTRTPFRTASPPSATRSRRWTSTSGMSMATGHTS